MNTHLEAYLGFNGDCRDAMEFYKSTLGGELTLQTFGEVPGDQSAEADKNRIIHAELKSGNIHFFASDSMPGQDVKVGDNVSLCLGGSDEAHLTDLFNKLSAGGTIDMPLEKQFWGDNFGMLTDKFSIHWMVNIDAEKEPEPAL